MSVHLSLPIIQYVMAYTIRIAMSNDVDYNQMLVILPEHEREIFAYN